MVRTYDNWTDALFDQRYGHDRTRVDCAWRMLEMFLKEYEITSPRQIGRVHIDLYMKWRSRPNKSNAKYRAGRNTAILELKFLSIIMDEAVRKNYCASNPLIKMGLHRDPQKHKPEFTRSAMAKILWLARKEPEPRRQFFISSFLIARYHGCRLSETHLNPVSNVEMGEHPTISFKTKGNRIHTVFLHPKLIRRFKHLQAAGKTETYTQLKSPAKEWSNFLGRIGIRQEIPGACFHSLRVTAATTLARKGIPEKKAMDYIGHASTTVHRSYVRLKPEDLAVCAAALD